MGGKMIKNLFVIRHGQAAHLVGEALTGGWTNSLLTELGKDQADATGLRISQLLGEEECELYCSDFLRARLSAEIIGDRISKTPISALELRELNNGNAANMKPADAKKIALPISEPIMDWVHYPNGESWRDLNTRVSNFMDRLQAEAKETVIIVSHRGPIVSIIDWWLELNEHYINKVSFDIDPCSITHLRINKWGEKTITKLNDTMHLLTSGF
jgi:broad specificity phosphatase PhoE